jgi:hypothetical protein
MHRAKLRKLAFRVIVTVAVLLAVIASVFVLEQRRTQAELGAVLSAYLSNELLHDAHDWGSGRGIQIVILREAQQPGTWPFDPQPASWRSRWKFLSDPRHRFTQASLITRNSFILSNAIPTNIRAQLHLPSDVDAVIVSRSELERGQPGDFERRFPNHLGYIAVSQPGLNVSRTEAIFYVDHFCGLCGGGNYILMRKVNEAWRVVDRHNVWVS